MKELSPVQQKFILHWGEMGTRWGINRTVAQIHALLFIAPKPLNAEDIASTLNVARSNVSNSLKELQGWRIVKLVHVLGDKRDHFESMKDPWEMFRIVLDERKRREIDPTLEMLRECIAEAEKDKATDEYTEERLKALRDFFEMTTAWYTQLRKWPT
ncbi:MAG TPA: MarR family transcriptional regulator, partial [Verrucomicrobiae bacterium]